jgi:V-type H+-transporting ATPase subunit D
MKIKLKGAQKGHSLLKRKSDALTVRFRQILQKIQAAKLAMGATMRAAAFSLTEVNYAAGDISYAVLERVGQAQVLVKARMENVSGVQLPVFEWAQEGREGSTTGETQWLGRGGQQVQKCREAFARSLAGLVELAALQTAFFVLDETIRITNRRVNALEYVVIPKVLNTVDYIGSELDEHDREDFFRLKKVQTKKKQRENEKLTMLMKELNMTDLQSVASKLSLEEESRNILLDAEDHEIFV